MRRRLCIRHADSVLGFETCFEQRHKRVECESERMESNGRKTGRGKTLESNERLFHQEFSVYFFVHSFLSAADGRKSHSNALDSCEVCLLSNAVQFTFLLLWLQYFSCVSHEMQIFTNI